MKSVSHVRVWRKHPRQREQHRRRLRGESKRDMVKRQKSQCVCWVENKERGWTELGEEKGRPHGCNVEGSGLERWPSRWSPEETSELERPRGKLKLTGGH